MMKIYSSSKHILGKVHKYNYSPKTALFSYQKLGQFRALYREGGLQSHSPPFVIKLADIGQIKTTSSELELSLIFIASKVLWLI